MYDFGCHVYQVDAIIYILNLYNKIMEEKVLYLSSVVYFIYVFFLGCRNKIHYPFFSLAPVVFKL